MGSALIEVRDEASASLVREAVRSMAREIDLDRDAMEHFAAAASELAFNQVSHARLGEITLRTIERDGLHGLELVARDRGPGMRDPPAALEGRLVGTGLGVGLAAVRNAVDELDVDVRLHEGTHIAIRRFVRVPDRALVSRHPEIAIAGRPYPGEPTSGDDAVFIRSPNGFLAAVADGLGHGANAGLASRLAMDVVTRNPSTDLPRLLALVDDALHGTRGSAMTVARFHAERQEVEVCGIGNIDTRLEDRRGDTHHHVPRSGTLGVRQGGSPPVVRMYPFSPGSCLVMCSDGIRQRDRHLVNPAAHPAAWTAHHLLEEHARATDDALVLVAR